MEKISVIVPVYRVEKYLRRCIESIINQDYSNLEIILVDDGSDDSSPQICDYYEKIDSRIIVIHQRMVDYLVQEIEAWRLLQVITLAL